MMSSVLTFFTSNPVISLMNNSNFLHFYAWYACAFRYKWKPIPYYFSFCVHLNPYYNCNKTCNTATKWAEYHLHNGCQSAVVNVNIKKRAKNGWRISRHFALFSGCKRSCNCAYCIKEEKEYWAQTCNMDASPIQTSGQLGDNVYPAIKDSICASINLDSAMIKHN